MTLLRSFFVVLAFASATACGTGPALPDEDADVVGTLTDFLPEPPVVGGPRQVLVTVPNPSHRKIVHVNGGTRLYVVEPDGDLRRAQAGDLAIGDELEVWTTGIELRSDPGQVFATRIHILR